MLNETKNRGAGLVTVVVVLAVCSILLSASIWLSFNHYKKSTVSSLNDTEQAELDLCAELFCMSLNKNAEELEDFTRKDFPLAAFYERESTLVEVLVDQAPYNKLIIQLRGGAKLIIDKSFFESEDTITISFNRDSQVVVSKDYYIKNNGSIYEILTEVPDENTSQ